MKNKDASKVFTRDHFTNKLIGPAALPPKDRQTQLFSLLFM
jgi:hypothetical protein